MNSFEYEYRVFAVKPARLRACRLHKAVLLINSGAAMA
jgi:hypothetical protein